MFLFLTCLEHMRAYLVSHNLSISSDFWVFSLKQTQMLENKNFITAGNERAGVKRGNSITYWSRVGIAATVSLKFSRITKHTWGFVVK